jgi:hypothetical protein
MKWEKWQEWGMENVPLLEQAWAEAFASSS